ncbi:hypothetical protein B0F90DRAFT_1668778 [Multifurca ochricompacta]|uniref:Uncharacterized protein n=1 Tax=Multifurca ochricompacta TaxID=376703 RepID=A0AAD4M2Z4_9AGAM|nr:hypothetical protein B0F90DRAFT_1668778 [Multifurca ochricompacta]
MSCQIEQGDHYMDLSRDLLEKHLQLMLLNDQTAIRHTFTSCFDEVQCDRARDAKKKLGKENSSQIKGIFQARKYRHLSRETFKIVKKASDRIRDDLLMDQIKKATSGSSFATSEARAAGSIPRNPFTDSHAISTLSTLTDVAVGDLDSVEMSTYQSEATGEAAVVLDLYGQDASRQQVVATFPSELFSGYWTDGEAFESESPGEAVLALSSHQQDGSTQYVEVTSPQTIPPDHRINQDGTIYSLTQTDILGPSSGE